MSELILSLPESIREFVDEQATTAGFASSSEYVLQLIEQARREAARARVEELLREGMEAGPPIDATDEWWDQFKAKCEEDYKRRKES
jgi:antitoxin ParD1/3/4